MRKVTKDIVQAFEGDYKLKKGNDYTDGKAMYFHENKIAEKRDGELWITNSGWSTVTTKERLNGLNGVTITQKNFNWYLNGKEWNGEWVSVNNFAK